MINKSILVGRLTKDPELRYTQSGVAVTKFTIACQRPFKNAEGNQEADFINCIAWRKQAENLATFMRKGQMLGVEGRIQTRNYDTNDGNKVFVTEIIADAIQFLEPKNKERTKELKYENGRDERKHEKTSVSKDGFYGSNDEKINDNRFSTGETIDIDDDDLPF